MKPADEFGFGGKVGRGFGEAKEDRLGSFLGEGGVVEATICDGEDEITEASDEFSEGVIGAALAELVQQLDCIHHDINRRWGVKR